MDLAELAKQNRTEILNTAARHGARNIRLFGSVAKGQAGEERDVDFLMEMEPGRSLLDRAALVVDLEQLLGRRVDVTTEKVLKQRIRNRVLKEAVPL